MKTSLLATEAFCSSNSLIVVIAEAVKLRSASVAEAFANAVMSLFSAVLTPPSIANRFCYGRQ